MKLSGSMFGPNEEHFSSHQTLFNLQSSLPWVSWVPKDHTFSKGVWEIHKLSRAIKYTYGASALA